MPRLSAEAKLAAGFLPEREPLPVPKGMQPARARAIWTEIVTSKPPAYFLRTDEPLLRRFCTLCTRAEGLERLMAAAPIEAPEQPRLERRLVSISAALAGLSGKLRLNPQGRIERHATVRSSEKGSRPPPWADELIGGRTVRPSRQ